MASILTNTSAMVALQNLRTINSNLVDAQNQISTGKKISSATDNSLFLVRGAEQPHQQKERHHSCHKVSVGDFPRPAMVTSGNDLFTLDNNRRARRSRHTSPQTSPPLSAYRKPLNKLLTSPSISRAIWILWNPTKLSTTE